MRKRRLMGVLIFAIPALLAAMTIVVAGDGGRNNRFNSNRMNGYQENQAVSTTGEGSFTAELDGDEIHYTLTYGALQGGAVTQAHVHLGRRAVNGGIIAWLCEGTLASPSASTPTCPPATGGSVSGTITALEVIGPTGQGVAPGEFAELIAALRAGAVYANVHTATFGGGEIRGQVNEKGAKDADKLDKSDDDED